MLQVPGRPGGGKRRCTFLNTYYIGFLQSHYLANPTLVSASYSEQLSSLHATFFGDCDFYSRGLTASGWEAVDLIVNCEPLQRAWAREHGSVATGEALILEQVRFHAPDVLYLQDLNLATQPFIESLRPLTTLICGQIASPVPHHAYLSGFDLIVTSFPHFTEHFRRQGITSIYQPLAFDARVLDAVFRSPRIHAVTFVGGISPVHSGGTEFLEKLAGLVPLDFWGYGRDSLQSQSAIRKSHHGEAWGRDMFGLLAASRITINRHIDTAADNANNMRLFEATGCGALLITDYKDNLQELFTIGKEIVAYRSPEECAALIEYYLGHPEAAQTIAKAGQARTLRDHSYLNRMAKTAEYLEYLLRNRRDRDKFKLARAAAVQTLPFSGKMESFTGEFQRNVDRNELAKIYAGVRLESHASLVDCLAPLLEPGSQVLEVGCGAGYRYEALAYLLGKSMQYVGMDYSPGIIALAREEHPRVDFQVTDGNKLPFRDDSVGISICSLTALQGEDWIPRWQEILRISSNFVVVHGISVCRSRTTYRPADGAETGEVVFNETELLARFQASGLNLIRTVESVAEAGADLYLVNYVFCKYSNLPAGKGKRHYCTLFDRNYLTRGIALAQSLFNHETQPYTLDAVCLDELSRAILEGLSLPNVVAVGLHEIEFGDKALLATRKDRSLVEYYFTLTATIIRWVSDHRPAADMVTYLDSDLYFFSEPEPIFTEFGTNSILIHGHRFPHELEHLATDNGIFNVGLLIFRKDKQGRAALDWWRDRCLEWCKAIPENGKMGDQKYLDDWPKRFLGLHVLTHVGAGLAPWNLARYHMEPGIGTGGTPQVDGQPVVFFHFHALGMPSRDVVVPTKHPHYPLTPECLPLLYLPYAKALQTAIDLVQSQMPSFTFGCKDMASLQKGVVILARPEVRIAGAESMPKVVFADGWLGYLSPQVRPRSPESATQHAVTKNDLRKPNWDEAIVEAEALFSAGRTREAKAALLELFRKNSCDSRVLNDLAVVAHSENSNLEAMAYLRESLKQNPGDRLTLQNMVDLGAEGTVPS